MKSRWWLVLAAALLAWPVSAMTQGKRKADAPARSNRGGETRGQERAAEVQGMNAAKRDAQAQKKEEKEKKKAKKKAEKKAEKKEGKKEEGKSKKKG